MLVKDDVSVAAGLLEFARADHVAGQQFVDETLAFLIDQDRAVAADALSDEHAGRLFDGRMQLDLVDIHQVGADRDRHHDTVAGDAGGAGGDSTKQVTAVMNDHVLVIAEAARCQDHRFGMDGVIGIRAFRHDARDGAVHRRKAGRRGVIHYFDAQFFDLVPEMGHQERADARAVLRRVDPLVGGAAGEGDLGKRCPDGIQPVDRRSGILGHDGDECLVVDVMAALHGVFHKLRDAVFDTLFLLVMRFRRVHAAGRLGGIAADVRHFFENDDLLAGLCRIDRSGHSRAACADDGDIAVEVDVVFDFDGFRITCGKTRQIRAGQDERVVESPEDRVARYGRAAQCVHLGTLGFQDLVSQHFHGE